MSPTAELEFEPLRVAALPGLKRRLHPQRFKSTKSARRFLSTPAAFYSHFNIQRHLISRRSMKQFRAQILSACVELIE